MARKRRRRIKTGTHTSSKIVNKNNICKYRSGWELNYMCWLDSNDEIASYCYEPMKIPYISNVRTKKVRNYIPDFLVCYKNGMTKLVEIKRFDKLSTRMVTRKLEAAKKWCTETAKIDLEVITEHELRGLGIL